jgi:hypothetical protein
MLPLLLCPAGCASEPRPTQGSQVGSVCKRELQRIYATYGAVRSLLLGKVRKSTARVKLPYLLLTLVVLIGGILFPIRSAEAHMYNNDHIGYYPGISDRLFLWYDETGLNEWTSVEYQHAVNYSINYALYWRGQGILLPYLDYHSSGGPPGCFNNLYAVDVCAGNPGSGYAALAQWRTDGTSAQHMQYGTITVRNPSGLSATQRLQAICQEIGHILGLHHDETGDLSSCMQEQLQPDFRNATFYRIHDDLTLRQFYGGHVP